MRADLLAFMRLPAPLVLKAIETANMLEFTLNIAFDPPKSAMCAPLESDFACMVAAKVIIHSLIG